MYLKFKKLHYDAILPTRGNEDDVGLDLYNLDDIHIPALDRRTLRTGLAVQLPKSYAGYIQSRSGLAHKFGIHVLNSPGLIDPGYRGELKVILHNTSDREVLIKMGARIAQLVVVPVETPEPVIVDELDETDRGDAGIGSTGGF